MSVRLVLTPLVLALLITGSGQSVSAEDAQKPDFQMYEMLLAWMKDRPAKWPAPLIFNGRNTFSSPPSAGFDMGAEGTIDFWICTGWKGALDYEPTIASYASKESFGYAIQLAGDAHSLIFRGGPRGLRTSQQSESIAFLFDDKRGHHVALSMGAKQTRFYVDGILKAEKPVTFGTDGSTKNLVFRIGSSPGPSNGFIGAIGNVRLWDKALSSAEVKKVRDVLGAPPATSPLRSHLVAGMASLPGAGLMLVKSAGSKGEDISGPAGMDTAGRLAAIQPSHEGDR